MDVWIKHAKAVRDCDLDISQAQVSFLFQSLLEDNCHMAATTEKIKFGMVTAKELYNFVPWLNFILSAL